MAENMISLENVLVLCKAIPPIEADQRKLLPTYLGSCKTDEKLILPKLNEYLQPVEQLSTVTAKVNKATQ